MKVFILGGAEMLFGNEYGYLNLEQLIDTTDNELIIVISQTKKIEPFVNTHEDEKLHNLLSKSMQLISDDTQTYKIYFENYIMYQGRNESYAYNSDDHISVGQGLILFEKSKLLDYYNDVIDVLVAMSMQQKSKLQHYGIYTLNNIIDVITFYEPVIEKVN